jgi:hypothetical protein
MIRLILLDSSQSHGIHLMRWFFDGGAMAMACDDDPMAKCQALRRGARSQVLRVCGLSGGVQVEGMNRRRHICRACLIEERACFVWDKGGRALLWLHWLPASTLQH